MIIFLCLTAIFFAIGESAWNEPYYKCLSDIDYRPCNKSLIRFAYDKHIKRCKRIMYGGCGETKNTFLTLRRCKNVCERNSQKSSYQTTHHKQHFEDYKKHLPYNHHICSQHKDPGYCKARILRYYFDKDKSKCLTFYYGGCQGNKNNFETKYQCEMTCYPKQIKHPKPQYPKGHFIRSYEKPSIPKYQSGALPNDCHLPKKVGPCEGHFTKFYYDNIEKKCKSFIFGGCYGNGNNFDSKERCEALCYSKTPKKVTVSLCRLQPPIDRCESINQPPILTYFYSVSAGKCIPHRRTVFCFDPEQNEFASKYSCASACETKLY